MEIGFEGAPVTRAIALITLTFSLAFDASALSLQLPALFRGQIWVSSFNSNPCHSYIRTKRVFTSHLPFSNSSQLIVGLILIYTLRLFERFMGSKKFGAFVFVSGAIATLSSLGLVSIASSLDLDLAPSPGPFFFIYSLLPLFYRKTPLFFRIYSV